MHTILYNVYNYKLVFLRLLDSTVCTQACENKWPKCLLGFSRV